MSNKIEHLITTLYNSRPREIWEIDSHTLQTLSRLKDDAGIFIWTPEPNYASMPGRLFGIPISIAKDKCLQLRFEFLDGHSHVIEVDRGMFI